MHLIRLTAIQINEFVAELARIPIHVVEIPATCAVAEFARIRCLTCSCGQNSHEFCYSYSALHTVSP
jgi:hypothetical protein